METGNILTADVLDIVFNNRNKEYGAYDLRKHYQRRLIKSLITMVLIVVLIMVTYLLVAAIKPKEANLIVSKEVTLEKIAPPEPPVTPPLLPPPPPPAATVKMLVLTAPLLVKEDVKPEDMPPPVDDLETAKIGLVNSSGTDDIGIVGPPVAENKHVVEMPKKQDEGETIFIKVEIESQYPGGSSAWAAFLNRNLNYPDDAVDNNVQGTVVIQFIVDLQGNVSDVTAISGPQELRAAGVAVIKQSSKWTAAKQNGKAVKSYKKQPIVFRLPE